MKPNYGHVDYALKQLEAPTNGEGSPEESVSIADALGATLGGAAIAGMTVAAETVGEAVEGFMDTAFAAVINLASPEHVELNTGGDRPLGTLGSLTLAAASGREGDDVPDDDGEGGLDSFWSLDSFNEIFNTGPALTSESFADTALKALNDQFALAA